MFFLADEPLYLAAVTHMLAGLDTELVTGGPYYEPEQAGGPIFNSAFHASWPSSISFFSDIASNCLRPVVGLVLQAATSSSSNSVRVEVMAPIAPICAAFGK